MKLPPANEDHIEITFLNKKLHRLNINPNPEFKEKKIPVVPKINIGSIQYPKILIML